MLADMLTIREHLGRLKGVRLVYMGDARYNMGNSLMVTCAKLGMDFVACTSKKYFPDAKLVEYCEGVAKETGASITLTEDVKEGTKDADVIYTDVWVSMGEEVDFKSRIDLLLPYQINADLLAKTENPDVIVMHCLPAFHDLNTQIGQEIYDKYGLAELEITDEVFQKYSDIIFQEAENRMHSIKAIMYNSLKNI